MNQICNMRAKLNKWRDIFHTNSKHYSITYKKWNHSIQLSARSLLPYIYYTDSCVMSALFATAELSVQEIHDEYYHKEELGSHP